MKKQIELFCIILLAALSKANAQQIKFPESFYSQPSLFKGMKTSEIPQDIQTKYGLSQNPGLVTDVAKAKGALFTAGKIGVNAIYFEIWKYPKIEKSDCGYEVAQFASIVELEKTLPKIKSGFYSAILTLQNYLIVVKCVSSKNAAQNIDKLTAYFQKKLGAKLFLDRVKEVERQVETAVTEKYVTNLPPPLPPEPKGNYTSIEITDLDKRIANTDGLAYMRTKNRQKLAPGKYRASSMAPAFESLVFTLDKDSLLHGDYEYHYAEDYSKSRSKESTYDHGVLTSEIVYEKGKLIGSTTFTASVVKEGNDYLITIKTTTKDPNNDDKEVLTLFRNRNPISKITTRAGVSVIKKDFEKKVLEHYNSKGQITKFQKPGLREEYDGNGKTTYKDEWINDDHFIYKNGKLVLKEIGVKGAQQYNVTAYDENGKITNQYTRGIEAYPAIANPDEQEWDLTEALFEYYRKKAK